jgi:hypothetical protein
MFKAAIMKEYRNIRLISQLILDRVKKINHGENGLGREKLDVMTKILHSREKIKYYQDIITYLKVLVSFELKNVD